MEPALGIKLRWGSVVGPGFQETVIVGPDFQDIVVWRGQPYSEPECLNADEDGRRESNKVRSESKCQGYVSGEPPYPTIPKIYDVH